jgi:hypothetical protein
MAGLSDRSAFEAFERVAERIEDSERHLLASEEVTEALTGDTLESEFAQLKVGDDVDARLLALKRDMGMLGAGDSERMQLGSGNGVEADSEGDESDELDVPLEEPVVEAELEEEGA